MARSRNIKPSIMDNEDLAALDPLARLLFIYLWMLADREGRLEDRPGRIAHQALGYDRTADVDALLDDLQQAGFILRYVAGDKACIQILQFAKHQAPHVREAASELPAPDTTKAVPEHNLGSVEASPRSPDSGFLIPDPLVPPPAAAPAKPSRAKPRTQLPEDFTPNDTGARLCAAAGFSLSDEVEKFKNHHKAAGSVMADWQAGFRTWIDKGKSFRKPWQTVPGVTVPTPANADAALKKLDADKNLTAPPPAEVRQRLAELRRAA
jgi:hypothetical protein